MKKSPPHRREDSAAFLTVDGLNSRHRLGRFPNCRGNRPSCLYTKVENYLLVWTTAYYAILYSLGPGTYGYSPSPFRWHRSGPDWYNLITLGRT